MRKRSVWLRLLLLTTVIGIAAAAACRNGVGDGRFLTANGDGSDTIPDDTAPPDTIPPDTTPEPGSFQRIATSFYSGFDSPARLVIRDQDAWRAFWRQLEAGSYPKTEPPPVDFSRETVLAVALGERNSGGYRIQVEQVVTRDGRLRVDVVETSPGDNCVVTAALTQPVEAVRVPVAAPRTVEFVTRQFVRDCS